MSSSVTNICLIQGKTFRRVTRWETRPIVYKAITAITETAPIRITATGHGLPEGWRAAVESVQGMTEINAANTPPLAPDYHEITVVDANTVEFNDTNALEYSTYLSGGTLRYNTPHTLTDYTARMTIKDMVGGTVLKALTTENGGIAIDEDEYTISLYISAADTAAFSWTEGVYDLEMVSSEGDVTQLLAGFVYVKPEVTT
jgi:hypothetical protein